MKLKNKFVVVVIVFIVAGLTPWIWLSNEYGLYNIPHYDLVMWIFMELYALIFMLLFGGVVVLMYADGDEQPIKRKRVSAAEKKAMIEYAHDRKKERDSEPQPEIEQIKQISEVAKKINGNGYDHEDGSYELPPVEYPAEWDQRRFE
jgi:hypothetical protein